MGFRPVLVEYTGPRSIREHGFGTFHPPHFDCTLSKRPSRESATLRLTETPCRAEGIIRFGLVLQERHLCLKMEIAVIKQPLMGAPKYAMLATP